MTAARQATKPDFEEARVSVHYRSLEPGEEARARALIVACFHEFVASDYSSEGVAGFLRYVDAEAMRRRLATDHFALIAEVDGDLAGVIEIRRNEHVSQLFVDGRFHGRGIARELFRQALERVRACKPSLREITVCSTRHALPVYESFGFRATDAEQTVNGLIFTPMSLRIEPSDADRASGQQPEKQRGADADSEQAAGDLE